MVTIAEIFETKKAYKLKAMFRENKYYFIILALLLVVLIINIVLKDFVFITLNENQILYTYATTAQVIGGIFALTLTGYIYYNDKLNKMFQEDESLFDVVEKLKNDYFKRVLVLGTGCLSSVLLSLACINLKVSLTGNLYNFLLNFSMFIFLLELMLIIKFSMDMVNPNSIINANVKLLNANKYDDKVEKGGDLQLFLADYNIIENRLMELSEKYFNKNLNKMNKGYYNKYRPGLMTALKILKSMKIISQSLYNDLNEMRMYRNSVIHSENPSISPEAEKSVNSLKIKVEQIYGKYK